MWNKRLKGLLACLAFAVTLGACGNPVGPADPFDLLAVNVQVSSEPWHANIWLDGEDTGQRTDDVIMVNLGTHGVRLLKSGYEEWSTTFTVTEGDAPTGGSWGGVSYRIHAVLDRLDITVTNPASGTTWVKGQEALITWEPVHTPPASPKGGQDMNLLTMTSGLSTDSDSVRILYLPMVSIDLYKGDMLVRSIAANIENAGSFSWTVDPALEDGSDYKVRVNAAPETPEIQKTYGDSAPFTIR